MRLRGWLDMTIADRAGGENSKTVAGVGETRWPILFIFSPEKGVATKGQRFWVISVGALEVL